MNDKEIRQLISECTSQEEQSAINPEEIKKIVSEKLKGKSAAENLHITDDGETVEPIYITGAKQKKPRLKIALTAAATAACVGIAGVGIHFLGGYMQNNSNAAESENGLETENTDSTELDEQTSVDDLFGQSDETSVSDNENTSENNNYYYQYLADGQILRYYIQEKGYVCDITNIQPMLELKDGALWFHCKGDSINITEAAGYSSYYIYTYYDYPENEEETTETGEQGNQTTDLQTRAHNIIINNTLSPYLCGYYELFSIDGEQYAVGYNMMATESLSFTMMLDASSQKLRSWFFYALAELGYSPEEIEAINVVNSNSGTPYVMKGESETIYMIDGSTFKWSNNDLLWKPDLSGIDLASVIIKKDERLKLCYSGVDGDVDVTDLIDESTPYIVKYENPYSRQTHYIVVGGTPDYCGYAELFEMNGKWYQNVPEYLKSQALDSDMVPTTPEWLKTAYSSLGIEENRCIIDTLYYPSSENLSEKAAEAINQPLPEGKVLKEEFRLLDNCWVKLLTSADGNGAANHTISGNVGGPVPLKLENGRLYFTGNGENIDVTDEISSDKAYVYSYQHPERDNETHYFIIGGDVENYDYGYAEIYVADRYTYPELTDEVMEHWNYDGQNYDNADYFNTGVLTTYERYKPWFQNVLDEMGILSIGGSGH